jgi:hypothetical protein
MAEVRTRDEAIASVDQALAVWSSDVAGLLQQAQGVIRGAMDEVDGAVRRCANRVAAMQALLAAADVDERPRLQAQLLRAREAHEQARRASVRVHDVAASVGRMSRVHTTSGAVQVSSARAQLAAMSRALEGYRSGGGALGGGGSSRGPAARAAGGPMTSMGLVELDVASADLDENPILDDDRKNATFGKGGLGRADYRWAVQTWTDTVGPGVAGGKTRDDFAARDAGVGAQPLRRTADVYDMFLGNDRIRVDRKSDGTLNIVNGRHRLLIARELGITTLPGEVS